MQLAQRADSCGGAVANTLECPPRAFIAVPSTKHRRWPGPAGLKLLVEGACAGSIDHMNDDDPIDLAALAREAGVPADDPGVQAFARLVAERCAAICEAAEPEGDADDVSRTNVRIVGRELGVKIRALFDIF